MRDACPPTPNLHVRGAQPAQEGRVWCGVQLLTGALLGLVQLSAARPPQQQAMLPLVPVRHQMKQCRKRWWTMLLETAMLVGSRALHITMLQLFTVTAWKGSDVPIPFRRRQRAPRVSAAEASLEKTSCCQRGHRLSEPDIKATTEPAYAGHQYAARCQACHGRCRHGGGSAPGSCRRQCSEQETGAAASR